MKRCNRFCAIVLAVIALFLSLPVSSVLAALPKILIVYAETPSWAADVQTKLMNTGKFSVVDGYDCRSAAPSLSLLMGYDGVLTFTDYSAAPGTADNLADYVDAGGSVVGAMFQTGGYGMSGRYCTPTYQVWTPSGYTAGGSYTMSVVQPSHPIMTGISSFSGGTTSWRAYGTLTSGAYVIANWTSGEMLIAAKEDVGPKKARRVDLGFFPPSTDIYSGGWSASTDGAKIMANALDWCIRKTKAQLAMSTHAMNFNPLLVGQNQTLCVTVSNPGTGDLTITSARITGVSDYSIVSGPSDNSTIAPNGSTSYCIRFAPLVNGNRIATFTLVTNGADSGTQMINLSGLGVAPQIVIPTNTLMSKTRVRLRDSATAYVRFQSTGNGPLTINSVGFTGTNADAYRVIYVPGTSVAAGTTDSIGFRFNPNFEGRSDAQLVINSNALNTPTVSINVAGVGILPRLVISPAALNFDSVAVGDSMCRTVTLSNPGTDSLIVFRSFFSSADYDFTYTGLSGSDSIILPNQSKLVTVCFRPLNRGTRLATVRVYTNIPRTFTTPVTDTSQFTFNVTGKGVPNGRLSFGGGMTDSVFVGQSHCMSDTIYNTGQSSLTVTGIYVSGTEASDYSVSGVTFPVTIAPGGSQIVSLCFAPTARGTRSALFAVNAMVNGRPTSISIPFSGFGLEACATATPTTVFGSPITLVGMVDSATVTVTNCGNVAATYSAAIATPGSVYSITSPVTSGSVAPNGTASFTLRFAPSGMGAAANTLNITGGPSPIAVPLGGIGGAVTTSTSATMPSVMVGDCQNFDVTIQNTGNVDFTLGAPTFSGVNASEYTIISAPATIAAGASGTVTIKFCPMAGGSRLATLNFAAGSPMPLAGSFSYDLSGVGLVSGVAEVVHENGFELKQNYPNPVNQSSTIEYVLPTDGPVRIDILDQTGSIVKTIVNEREIRGAHSVTIHAGELASGSYYYVLTSGSIQLTRHMTLIK